MDVLAPSRFGVDKVEFWRLKGNDVLVVDSIHAQFTCFSVAGLRPNQTVSLRQDNRETTVGRAEEEMTDLTDMTTGELDELLTELQADFEDVEQERMFVLGQTGVHISASTAKKYEAEVDDLRTRIEEVEKVIRAKKSAQV